MGLTSLLANFTRKRGRNDAKGSMLEQSIVSPSQILIRGQKTVIRTFGRADVDKWLAWPEHPDPLYSSSYPRPMHRNERDAWFYERTNRTDYYMFALDDYDGNLVGLITLRNIEPHRAHAVLGITLRPEVLTQGFGTDGLWAFLHYYFDMMGFEAMILDVAAYNRRAQRVYEKCGFVYTGEHWAHFDDESVFYNNHYNGIRQYFRRTGGWVETLFYDMVLHRYDFDQHRKGNY